VPRFIRPTGRDVIRPTGRDVIRHRGKVPSGLRRRWFTSHVVGQYGRRYDGNLTMKTQFSLCMYTVKSVERRILTRASFHPTYGGNSHPTYGGNSHPTYGGNSHPASGKGVIRFTASMVCESHRRSAWTEARRKSDNWKRSFHRGGAGVSATDFREDYGTSRGCTNCVERRILTRTSFHPTYGERCHPVYGVDDLRVTP